MNNLAAAYLATWNETDDTARLKLLKEYWADNASYVDPMAEAAGHDVLNATIGAVQQQFPGFVFTPVGEVDTHHRQARFQWGLGPEGAEPVVIGFDVIVADEDGRIETVLGFLDRVPSAVG